MVNGEWIGQGVAFSPYRDGQGPDAGLGRPSTAETLADLKLTARYWKFIRMYDCTSVTEETLRLIHTEHLPLKLMLGIWIVPDKSPEQQAANRREITSGIRLARAYPDEVVAVAVGNEACVWWSGYRTPVPEMVAHIREVRAAVAQPVTVADDFDFWNKPESRAVAAEVDFLVLHAYALWHGQQVDHAVDWLADVYASAVKFHAGVPIIIGETGWATQHDTTRTLPGQEGALMQGETSEAAQLNYLRQHYRWVREHRIPTLLFEAFDENWKGDGVKSAPTAAEKHWGVFTADRKPKSSFVAIMREFYPEAKAGGNH